MDRLATGFSSQARRSGAEGLLCELAHRSAPSQLEQLRCCGWVVGHCTSDKASLLARQRSKPDSCGNLRLGLDLLGSLERIGGFCQRRPRGACQAGDRFAHRAAAGTASHPGGAQRSDVGEDLFERARVSQHLGQLSMRNERRVETSGKC